MEARLRPALRALKDGWHLESTVAEAWALPPSPLLQPGGASGRSPCVRSAMHHLPPAPASTTTDVSNLDINLPHTFFLEASLPLPEGLEPGPLPEGRCLPPHQSALHVTVLPSPPMLTLPVTTTPPYLARFCAAWVYCGMATVGVSLMERAKRCVVGRIHIRFVHAMIMMMIVHAFCT